MCVLFTHFSVSIPNLFGSSSTTITSSLSNDLPKKNKKKNSISQDTLETALVDSMSIAAAVAVPNEPSISEVIKNGGSDEKDSSEAGSSLPESSKDNIEPQKTTESDTKLPVPHSVKVHIFATFVSNQEENILSTILVISFLGIFRATNSTAGEKISM